MTDSATGGVLQPTSPAPLEGEAMEDFFSEYLSSLSGVNGKLVRPAWQPIPPNIPIKETIWIAFHFVDTKSDTFPFIGQFKDGGTIKQSQLQNNEEFNVHCSVYGTGAGSQARAVAKLIRDNAMVPQNQEELNAQGFFLIAVPSAIQPVPTLVKNIWSYRVDFDIPIRRTVVRDYDVKTIQSAKVDLIAQTSDTTKIEATIDVEQT